MPDYQKGKIYKLIEERTGEIFYVGSTALSLSKRMSSHLSDYKRKPARKLYKYITEKIGIENVKIFLICHYPCNSLEELFAEERRQAELIGYENLQNARGGK